MNAISLWQPWASAIPLLLKRIETRGRSTKVRGRIAIHAAKRWTGDEKRFTDARRRAGDPLPEPLPLGAIVATAVLYDCRRTEDVIARGVSDLELMYGNYEPGRFCWMLREIVPLAEPIPWSGKQGWFEVADWHFPEEARRPSTLPLLDSTNPQTAWPFPVSAHQEASITP